MSETEDTTPEQECQNVIKSFQVTIGNSAYCKKARNRFLFGPSKALSTPDDFPSQWATIVPTDRQVVLVVHGGHEDIKVLGNLGVDCHAAICVIDTVKAAQTPLQLSYRYSLEVLLEALGIPYANLRAAGNDAHFCLRALLMLAVVDGERECERSRGQSALDDKNHHLFQVLRTIAQAPRPMTRRERDELLAEARKARAEAEAESRLAQKEASIARLRARRAVRTERRKLERMSHVGEDMDKQLASKVSPGSTPDLS